MDQRTYNKFATFSWGVLVINLGVILWGAYVRATGSGAGCGSHWPDCQGEIIPRAPQIETLIEYFHRISSGVAFILVLVMLLWAWKLYPRGNPVRLGSGLSMFFMITEALVGAALVKFQWVAQDVSIGRVVSISVHFINTLFLLASITLTAWWASGVEKPVLHKNKLLIVGFAIAITSMIILGVSGAITALGDTLFPSESLLEGIRQDFTSTAHFLLKLRVWHPVVAIFSGFYILFLAYTARLPDDSNTARILARSLSGLVIIQLTAGVINLLLLAPIPMQLIHLLLADLVWINLIVFISSMLSISQNHI